MTETAEFRVAEEFAHLLFSDDEGRKGGAVRRIAIDTSDLRFAKIGELQEELRRRHNRPFYYGWDVVRRYTNAELETARWLMTPGV